MFRQTFVRGLTAVALQTTVVSALLLAVSSIALGQVVLTLTNTGAGSVTIPAGYDWTNVTVQCWGGGGGGGDSSLSSTFGGGGGGGGAYSSNLYITPLIAGTYSYYVGTGGAGGGYLDNGGSGGNTIWNYGGIQDVIAGGGAGGGYALYGGPGGSGGTVGAGTGYSGGYGGGGGDYFFSYDHPIGGGGGGSGGPSGLGGAGGDGAPNGLAVAGSGGVGYGLGGGGGFEVAAGNGSFPGGGGGGGDVGAGRGASGEIVVTYTPVYCGQVAWSARGGGSWGALTTNFGTNWGGAGYGSPGLNPSFPDSATLGSSVASGTATVTLDGASPNLAALTFSNSAASYVIAAGSGGTLQLNGGTAAAALTDSAGSHAITAPVALGTNAIVSVANAGDTLTISGLISGSGALTMSGAGTLVLAALNTYAGGTTILSGTLQGNTTNLRGTITDNAALVFNQTAAGTFAGSITGNGGMTLTGGGSLTLPTAETFAATGGITVTQGSIILPLGLNYGGQSITLASAGTLQANGQVKRAVSGTGTITATGDLIIGNSQQAGQFDQGGAPGVGGTLNIGNNALVILSANTAVLGSQTNLGPGGSLTALNGAQLGNQTSIDATKVLTAKGNATINANFVNNGVVNGPTGTGLELTFTQAVQGAGSTTGNVEYAASYRVGNSPDAVSVQNVLLDPTSTLIMELAGDTPGSGYDQLDISGLATLNGTLDVTYLDGFYPSAGDSFEILEGRTTGSFLTINLPSLSNGLSWNTSNLDTNGTISVVPEPSTLALLATGVVGLLAYGWRQRNDTPQPQKGKRALVCSCCRRLGLGYHAIPCSISFTLTPFNSLVPRRQ